MNLHVGCRLASTVTAVTHAVVLVDPHSSVQHAIVEERWKSGLPSARFTDLYGNVCRRVDLTAENGTFEYDATIRISPDPEPMPGPDDVQHRIEQLSPELLHWLLPSRLCESDRFIDQAWELFGASPRGAGRVQAVCDWIHEHIRYEVGASTAVTTAYDVWESRTGVCRDFTHLGITLCRALNVPARYVAGYLPDIGVIPPDLPMDFCSWFEAWLDGRWWIFDPRNNEPRIGRVVIARGRDALDAAMVTTWGAARLQTMTVWADEAGDVD
jgi:transglutaminase-like putative cysteine protease